MRSIWQGGLRRLGAALALLLAATFSMLAPAQAAAVSAVASSAPVDLVKTFHKGLIDAIRTSDGKGFDARRDKLKPVISKAFDSSYMVQVATGTYWSTMSADQQKSLASAFCDMTIANYASRFKSYKGQSFDIVDSKPLGKRTLVESSLKRSSGDPVNIDYVVQPSGGNSFNIVDVRLGGTISEIALRKSEFAPVLRDKGYAGLIALLRDKTKEIASGAAQ